MSDYDYQITFSDNDRNPKNRFFGVFCHANEVDNSWGCNLSFSCGLIFLSIFIGLGALSDIIFFRSVFTSIRWFNFFHFMFFMRILSDLLVIIGIIYAILSICKINFKFATVAYYCIIISFLIDLSFTIYIIVLLIFYNFWSLINYRIIVWAIDGAIMFLFCWFSFCNMVVIGRKSRQLTSVNNFYSS